MSADDLKKLLASESPDAAALDELARRAESDDSLRAELESAAGHSEFAAYLKPLARTAPPLPPSVSAFVERMASHAPDAPAPAPVETLTTLGSYTKLEPIGRGGMGTVYRAFDSRLCREVALKMLSPALGASTEARERFQREARAAAALDHPNILPIHAFETIEGRDVLVLALNDGENLDAIIRREGPLPLDELIRIGTAVADGLAAAHAAGITHRDIKPANLLLSADRSEVRIADFGLARIADDPSLTRSGTLAGTPHFLSPEQAQGTPAEARSDIFSLGATLYFAATARLPFPGDDTPAVLRAVTHDTPPPAKNLPEWLRAMLGAMLEKTPARRPQSAAEIATALRTRSARWSRRKWQRLALRAAAILCVATASALGFTQWRESRAATEALRQRATAEQDAATPFIVTGKAPARFAAIAAALAAMKDGDTLTIEKGGIFMFKPHDFGGNSATIRGGRQRAVVLTPTSRDASLFSTAAQLRIENLNLIHANGFYDPAPLVLAEPGATISLDRCRVTTPSSRARAQNLDSIGSPIIRARTPVRVEASHSIITARRSSLVEFTGDTGTATLGISDCGIGINSLVRAGRGTKTGVGITLRNSIVSVASLVILDGATTRITASGKRCFFDVMDAPVRAPGFAEGDVLRLLAWHGEENAWQLPADLINFSRDPDVRSTAIPSTPALDRMRLLFPGSDTDSLATNETMRDRLATRRVNPSFVQSSDFKLPEGIARRAPNIGIRTPNIGPE